MDIVKRRINLIPNRSPLISNASHAHVTAGQVNASSAESERLYLLYLSADHQTVGCDVCHGPGKRHILSAGESDPVRLPAKEICTQCHTPDRDSNFIYQKKWQPSPVRRIKLSKKERYYTKRTTKQKKIFHGVIKKKEGELLFYKQLPR